MSAQVSVSRSLPSLDYGVGAGVALLLAGLIGYGLARAGAEPLQMSVYGELGQIPLEAVNQTVAPFLPQGFFQLDADMLERRIEQLPWVRKAQVERLWPNRLAVRLESYAVLAHWGDGAVLTTDGSLIEPLERPSQGLTVLAPDAFATAVYQDLSAILPRMPADWSLMQWQVSATGDRQARVQVAGQPITLEFGREPVAEKFKLLADLVLPILQPRLAQLEVVDLRYRNGFAVRWSGDAAVREMSYE